MTVNTRIVMFDDSYGAKYHGGVFWDKRMPHRLRVPFCPVSKGGFKGYQVRKSSSDYSTSEHFALWRRRDRQSQSIGLTIVRLSDTKYAGSLGKRKALPATE